jgi:hypothetical protein
MAGVSEKLNLEIIDKILKKKDKDDKLKRAFDDGEENIINSIRYHPDTNTFLYFST